MGSTFRRGSRGLGGFTTVAEGLGKAFSMKQMEPRIQDALYYQKLQPALRAYLKKLREEAFIDVRQGYVDTGASPNQTKPVETPGKEAGAKNLKKKKKLGIFK